MLETYVNILEPFKLITEVMSGDTYPTLSLYAPMAITLRTKCTNGKISNRENSDISEIYQTALDSLQVIFSRNFVIKNYKYIF